MNMFTEADRKKTEDAAAQIREDHARDSVQAKAATEVMQQLLAYIGSRPILQNVDVGTLGNVVRVFKTAHKRGLQIICGEADTFSLVEQRPEFPVQVGQPYPTITTNRPIPKDQMTKEVTSWLAA